MKFVFLKSKKGGFTLIELMVSLAIFAFTTAFLLAKYGSFNQNTLLTNLAYDTALSIRSAQSYGLNVQGTDATASCTSGYQFNGTCFAYAYGIHFDSTVNNQFILFIDTNNDGVFNSNSDTVVSTYKLNPGYTISGLCSGSSAGNSCVSQASLDITFKRPVPDAIIVPSETSAEHDAYSQVTFSANGQTANVVVQSTGEISVNGN